jgi:hypothetical protein
MLSERLMRRDTPLCHSGLGSGERLHQYGSLFFTTGVRGLFYGHVIQIILANRHTADVSCSNVIQGEASNPP